MKHIHAVASIGAAAMLVIMGVLALHEPEYQEHGPEAFDAQGRPNDQGTLYSATELNRTALFLEVNYTSEKTARIVVKLEEPDTHVMVWRLFTEVFDPFGSSVDGGFLGLTMTYNREPVVITHEGEQHSFGPKVNPAMDTLQSQWDPPAETELALEPGTNHVLVGLVHFSAIVTIEAAPGYENVLVPEDQLIDPGLVTAKYSFIEGDWDEVETEVWVTYDGSIKMEASTTAVARYNRTWGWVSTGGYHNELEVHYSNGESCREEGIPAGIALPTHGWSWINFRGAPMGPIEFHVDSLVQKRADLPPHLTLYDLPLPPYEEERLCWEY